MQEKSRFMVSWVPYRNQVAGIWFRQEKPLRFRAGPAGAAQARPARENRADVLQDRTFSNLPAKINALSFQYEHSDRAFA